MEITAYKPRLPKIILSELYKSNLKLNAQGGVTYKYKVASLESALEGVGKSLLSDVDLKEVELLIGTVDYIEVDIPNNHRPIVRSEDGLWLDLEDSALEWYGTPADLRDKVLRHGLLLEYLNICTDKGIAKDIMLDIGISTKEIEELLAKSNLIS